MAHSFKATLGRLATIMSLGIVFSAPALAALDDLGGYHIRFVGERQCLSDIDENPGPLTAWPCRTFDDDPAGRFDPFGPFYVLVFIRNEPDHQWLEFRLSGQCVSVTNQLGRPRRPYQGSLSLWGTRPEVGSDTRV